MRSVKNFLLTIFLVSLTLCTNNCGGDKKKEAPSAEESMVKNKEVRIITSAVNAPFEFGSGTGVQGYAAEIAVEIAKELKYPINWAKSKGYDHLFDILNEGGGEMIISSTAADPKKEQLFDFSKPYYETGDVIAHQRQALDIKDLNSLAGKKVGVAEGRPGDLFMTAQKTAANVTIKKYPTMDDALGALNHAEVDAVVGDEILITYSSNQSYQNTSIEPNLINKYGYAVAVRKGEAELLKKINAVIERMKSSGDLAKLESTWIGSIKEDALKRLSGDKSADAAKKSPKTISVTINKLSGSWPMDTLDGFEFVLEGPGGRYVSTPILTEGNRGTCRFARPVPPGDYKLNISILGIATTVPVPAMAKSTLSMTMDIAKKTTISFK